MQKVKKYNGLKLKLSKLVLEKHLKSVVHEPKTCSIENAKSVGITFAVTSRDQLDKIKKLLKELASMDIQTYALGYIPEKKPDDFYLSQKSFNFFYDKELDFLLRPKNESAIEFEHTPFDILIDFGSVDYYPMNVVIRKSKAKFKIGFYEEDGFFDLMINIKNKQDYKYFFEQVIHYLAKFNN